MFSKLPRYVNFQLACIMLILFISNHLNGQSLNKTIHYDYDASNFPNPERGLMYNQTINCEGISDFSIAAHRRDVADKTVNKGYTILWKYYTLIGYTDKPLPDEFIEFLQTDFEIARSYGVKIIPRFLYSNSRTKSPPWDASPERVLEHIDQVAPVLQANSDIIVTWQAGWMGRHGEVAKTTHYGPPNTTIRDVESMANRRLVIQKMLDVLPENRTISVRYPKDKQGGTVPHLNIPEDTITREEAFSNTFRARVGYFNDSYLADHDDRGTYQPADSVNDWKNFVKGDTKYVPFGGETSAFWSTTYYKPDSVYKLSDEFNLSYLNQSYHPDVIDYWKGVHVWDSLSKRLGYRFYLNEFSYNSEIGKDKKFRYRLNIRNLGFATPFNPRDCEFVFVGNGKTIRIKTNEDPRFWDVGDNTIEGVLTLGNEFEPGNYQIYLNLPDPESRLNKDSRYSIRLANKSAWNPNTGYNSLNASISIPTPPPPVIETSYPAEVFSAEEVVVDASDSYDPEGGNITLSWEYPNDLLVLESGDSLVFIAPKYSTNTTINIKVKAQKNFASSEKTISILIKPIEFSDIPDLQINYNHTVYGGKRETLDASGSLEPVLDNSDLSINWIAPKGVSLSSNSEPVIDFLPPDTNIAVNLKFFLVVTVNSITEYKAFDIAVEPYKPMAPEVKASKLEASNSIAEDVPENLTDGNLGTSWSSWGIDQWVSIELEKPIIPDFIKVAFKGCEDRQAKFDLYASTNKLDWFMLAENQTSCGYSNNPHIYDKLLNAASEIKYIRLVGKGNTVDENNSFSELMVFEDDGLVSLDHTHLEQTIEIYPNPAHLFLHVNMPEDKSILELYTSEGKLILHQVLAFGTNEIDTSKLPAGNYFVRIIRNTEIPHTEIITIR